MSLAGGIPGKPIEAGNKPIFTTCRVDRGKAAALVVTNRVEIEVKSVIPKIDIVLPGTVIGPAGSDNLKPKELNGGRGSAVNEIP